MAKPNLKHSALFFHMGPGFHARIEAQKFSATYPHVRFLDQPQDVTFAQLIDWACVEIKNLFQENNAPIKLLGHSFGGQLIAGALPRVHQYVSEVRLLNSAYDSFSCFVHLGKALGIDQAQGFSQNAKNSIEDKMNLIFQVAQHPQFAEVYWKSSSAMSAYAQLSASHPTLDLQTFVKAFSSYLQEPPPKKTDHWGGAAKIYYSLDDVLVHDMNSVSPWKSVFSNVQFSELPGLGHYAHFESGEAAAKFFKD